MVLALPLFSFQRNRPAFHIDRYSAQDLQRTIFKNLFQTLRPPLINNLIAMVKKCFDLGLETTNHGRQPSVNRPTGVSMINGKLIKHAHYRLGRQPALISYPAVYRKQVRGIPPGIHGYSYQMSHTILSNRAH